MVSCVGLVTGNHHSAFTYRNYKKSVYNKYENLWPVYVELPFSRMHKRRTFINFHNCSNKIYTNIDNSYFLKSN